MPTSGKIFVKFTAPTLVPTAGSVITYTALTVAQHAVVPTLVLTLVRSYVAGVVDARGARSAGIFLKRAPAMRWRGALCFPARD